MCGKQIYIFDILISKVSCTSNSAFKSELDAFIWLIITFESLDSSQT